MTFLMIDRPRARLTISPGISFPPISMSKRASRAPGGSGSLYVPSTT